MSTKQFTPEEVSKHTKEGDLWVIIDSKVFDLSKFCAMHPGGLSVLLDEDVAGQDATEAFFGLHRQEVLLKPQYARLQIGVIAGEEQQDLPPRTRRPERRASHRAFQVALRKFFETEVLPDAFAREEDGKRPSQSVFDAMARTNIIAMRLGPGPHLKGRVLLDGVVKPEEVRTTHFLVISVLTLVPSMTTFHELIMAQEGTRFNSRGYLDGLGGGTYIGLPPILNFGQPALREKIIEEVFSGKKLCSLAITGEGIRGLRSGLKCFAKRTDKGWVVTGTKKWITNGTFCDYFTVGCASEKGMVVLVIERGPGVETKQIKTSYSTTAGTAYITFDEVLVPYENTLGEDGKGLQVILSNFNHERWGMTCGSISSQRMIVEECLKWASQRKVFGKPLTSQAVIRSKLAAMISRVESAQAWIENVTFQMCNMDYKQQSAHLAGQIAFVKMYATKTAQETAADAVQIFGGRGITRTGMGKHIEHYHRHAPTKLLFLTVPFDSVLGGAEDVLGDLGVRQAMRKMPKNARL
ncbi:acyl-CoA dehydrogenase [Mycena vulgaris]|nr:acyl-CoA dehydrogenase [Mycena vulgaris]